MLDITNDFVKPNARDIDFADTDVYKAKNILDVQVGSLWFTTDAGIDLVYYILSELEFQPETFNTYILGQLIKKGIAIKDYASQVKDFVDELAVTI